ncbi:hypothetical protein K431DRAFT_273754 [Polychaeton citri CBS 116435]|uniref:Autophagy-related protein 14 n=1 Tax=Polychaeton citri CBS 116435 TaxID=1314669 RepID=A0A9P4Q1I7_9PEZI|nr:hypothetical protein K431DRAFT_273754 [Polychaeton citri CBS 116435]
MASTPPVQQPTSGRQDRPWLLPSNRRLRNLVSISLRNLSLQPSGGNRPRGKTIDDDAAPNALKSPAKLVAVREQRTLSHSRSSSDLTRVDEAMISSDSDLKANGIVKGKVKDNVSADVNMKRTPERPSIGRMRRRSTLEWVNATPQKRQERLEKVTSERMVDCFYSLHVENVEGPIYISEIVHQTMNPNFKHIDFSCIGPALARLDSVLVRFWVTGQRLGGWRQLLELSLHFQSLQFLGRSLEGFHHQLPPNAVVFRLLDGVYTVFTSLTDYALPHASLPPRASSIDRSLTTASFDTLLRLAKLDESIQDAVTTRNQIAADLEKLVQQNDEAFTKRDRVQDAQDRLKTIEFAKKTVEKQMQKAQRQRTEKQNSISRRRVLMQQDLATRAQAAEQFVNARDVAVHFSSESHNRRKAIEGQRRRICEDLQNCYPIVPVPKAALDFTIRGLRLPNSDDLDREPPETVAAALGHIAHVILLLSMYLAQPLPYPVTPRSSQSMIEDPLSLLKTNASTTARYIDDVSLRTYPLFSKGVPRFRFEYAVFLLNKDIQILLEDCFNVRVMDIRQTLPNLKYLLYVATAGEGDLPARKAGGVRGLMKPGFRPSLGSRQGSSDSTGSALSGLLWHAGGIEGNGVPKGALDSLRKNMGSLDRPKGKA